LAGFLIFDLPVTETIADIAGAGSGEVTPPDRAIITAGHASRLHWRCRKTHGFRGSRNGNEIHDLHTPYQKFSEIGGCFYRHFWKQK
jgi:hypothetical protein